MNDIFKLGKLIYLVYVVYVCEAMGDIQIGSVH